MTSNKNCPTNNFRSCGSCTMCCQGWLYGVSYNHLFQPGKPCHFLCESGCSIYDNRPEDPCKSYRCAWLMDSFLPEWFKPNLSKVICTWREWKNNENYLEVIECGEKIDSSILSWLFIQHLNGHLPNFTYKLSGGFNVVGSSEFLEYMNVRRDIS